MVDALGRVIACLFAFVVFSSTGVYAQDTEHLRLRLVPAYDSVTAGGDVYIGLEQVPAKGWHTYWRNPGDTGLAPEIDWDLPDGVSVDPVLWPAPQRLAYSGGMTYGYDHPSTLLVRLHNRSAAKAGEQLVVTAHVFDLVCENLCEPVSADLTLRLDVTDGPAPLQKEGRLAQAFEALPRALDAKAVIAKGDGMLTARIYSPQGDKTALSDFASPEGAYLFPEVEGLSVPNAPQTLKSFRGGFALTLKSGEAEWPTDAAPAVLRFANGHAYRLSFHDAAAAQPAAAHAARGGALGLWAAMVMAFAGGLILNLMPCVFPILSMKLLALTRAGHDQALARRESLVYGLGVVLSFLALALALVGARALGSAVGWGFQLQSPAVTGSLSLLLLLVALNMSGLFEVGASLQALAGEAGSKVEWATHPYMNALLTGVLAVVVAAPCSAPFMATAVGAALAQSGAAAFAIFIALGLGFALPFIGLVHGLSVTPQAIRLLPKPGMWMVRLRHILALPMYAAAAWMVWVFSQQASALGLWLLLSGLGVITVILAFARLPRLVRLSGAAVVLGLVVGAAMQGEGAASTPQMQANAAYQPFSAEALAELRAQGRPVLVDLTAAWCVTCKVNERLVLSNPKVKKAIDNTHTVYMVGDWTRRDAAITKFLSDFGRSGVPLYVYYAPGDDTPQLLPQVLDVDQVVSTLQKGMG